MIRKIYNHNNTFCTERGYTINNLQVVYHTAGTLNSTCSNVIWICHPLTASSDVNSWWQNSVGSGLLFDTNRYFVICVNTLGSAYGTTSALSVNCCSGEPYYHSFPDITVRDTVSVNNIIREHIGIKEIALAVGCSIGGFQTIEWSVTDPGLIKGMALIASSYRATPWAIAINESQRMAIKADRTWSENRTDAGRPGLKAARSIALLSYRNYNTYNTTQDGFYDDDCLKPKASSYQQYQGNKIVTRFNAFSYISMLNAFDSHNIGRGRGTTEEVLESITTDTLIIGIDSDILFPVKEQHYMNNHIKGASIHIVESVFGHDGFLIEANKISPLITGHITKLNK